MASIVGWTIDRWPFDMVKFLDYFTLIFHDDGTHVIDVYEAYCGTDNIWVATKVIDGIGAIDAPTTYPINIDVADFGKFYILTYAQLDSGVLDVQSYYRDPSLASSTSALTALPISTVPLFVSCCNFKGQVIGGGIVSGDSKWNDLGRASVAWSKIGQMDFELADDIGQGIKGSGYMKMPWSEWDQGMVYKVKRLGNSVMVYGNGGIAQLVPFKNEYVIGFGLKETVNPGVASGFVIGGNENLHGFIDINDEFWLVSGEGKFEKLGYKEWLSDLRAENEAEAAGTPICVSYSKVRKQFYICGTASSYILTEHGLCTCTQSVSEVGDYRGAKTAGFIKDLNDDEAKFTLVANDFGYRGMKTLETLEFAVDYTGVDYTLMFGSDEITFTDEELEFGGYGSTVYGGVDFKYMGREAFRSGTWKALNDNGVCFPLITATDFRVKFKCTDYRSVGLKIDSILARLKLSQRIQSDSSRATSGQEAKE